MKNVLIIVICILCCNQYVKAQEYPFEVTTYGKGDPVLLVPGFACTAEVWETTIAELEDKYELHVFTLAGFGEVEPIAFPWLPKIKEGFEKYLKEKELKNPKFVGHSMGGTLGLWLAAENPNMLSKVISVDGLPAMGAVMFPNYNPDNFVYESPFNQQMLAMNNEQFLGMANQFANSMTLTEEKKALITEWMVKADRKTYVYGYTDLLTLDLRSQLTKITTPVTVFAATEPFGKVVVKSNMEKQFENLNEYQLILAEASAHFIMFDKETWFIEKLKTELSE